MIMNSCSRQFCAIMYRTRITVNKPVARGDFKWRDALFACHLSVGSNDSGGYVTDKIRNKQEDIHEYFIYETG